VPRHRGHGRAPEDAVVGHREENMWRVVTDSHGEFTEERLRGDGTYAFDLHEFAKEIVRTLGAACGDLTQSLRAEPSELNGRRHGHQRLIRADVRRRLFSADVLLSGAQRRHE